MVMKYQEQNVCPSLAHKDVVTIAYGLGEAAFTAEHDKKTGPRISTAYAYRMLAARMWSALGHHDNAEQSVELALALHQPGQRELVLEEEDA